MVDDFLEKMAKFFPRWIVFNGKDPVDDCYAPSAKIRRQGFRLQAWTVEGSQVYVAPSTSPRVRDDMPINGPDGVKRPALHYWVEMGDFVRELRKGCSGCAVLADAVGLLVVLQQVTASTAFVG